MNVLWLGHFVPWPLRGGSMLRSYHLLKEASVGGQVSFVGFYQRDLQRTQAEVVEAQRALQEFCRSVHILRIPAERGPLFRERLVLRGLGGRSYDEAWLRSSEMKRVFLQEVETFRPDLVHVDTIGLAPYALHTPGLPVALNHHNVESHMMQRRAEQSGTRWSRLLFSWQARLLRDLERRWVPKVGRNLVVSELDAQRLKSAIPGAAVDVVPNGVDTEYFTPSREPTAIRPRSLIFVGGLNYYPNLSAMKWFLEDILPLVREIHPDVELTVVGKKPSPADRTLGSPPGVHFTGEVPDIRPFVCSSAVFVCPMREGGGTRLKILDALAQGIPLVATRMAVEGIPVTHGREAMIADTPDEFAHAIDVLFKRADLLRELSEAGRRFVEARFAWHSVGERLRASYRACLGLVDQEPCAAS